MEKRVRLPEPAGCPGCCSRRSWRSSLVFFFWPAGQALYQSCCSRTRSALELEFVGLENFQRLFERPDLPRVVQDHRGVLGCWWPVWACRSSLLLAVMADRVVRGAGGLQDAADLALRGGAGRRRRAVAVHVRAVDRHRQPTALRGVGIDWNHLLNGNHAMTLIVMAAVWKQISLQLPVLPGRPAVDPEVADRGRRHRRRRAVAALLDDQSSRCCRRPPSSCWSINVVYAFFDTFAIVDAATAGRPRQGHRDPGLQGLQRRLQGARPGRLGGAVGGADGDRDRAHGGAVPLRREDA